MKAEGARALTAPEGKAVCDAYGIPVPKEGVATTPTQRREASQPAMGYPVVLKIACRRRSCTRPRRAAC